MAPGCYVKVPEDLGDRLSKTDSPSRPARPSEMSSTARSRNCSFVPALTQNRRAHPAAQLISVDKI
jgi:hypothetical protein